MRRKLRKGSKAARVYMAQIRGMRRGKKHKRKRPARRRITTAWRHSKRHPRKVRRARKSRVVRGKKNPRLLTQKHGGGWKTKRRKARKGNRLHVVSFKPHKGGKRFYFATDEARGSFLTTSKAAAKRFISEEMALKVGKNLAKNPALRAKFRSILIT